MKIFAVMFYSDFARMTRTTALLAVVAGLSMGSISLAADKNLRVLDGQTPRALPPAPPVYIPTISDCMWDCVDVGCLSNCAQTSLNQQAAVLPPEQEVAPLWIAVRTSRALSDIGFCAATFSQSSDEVAGGYETCVWAASELYLDQVNLNNGSVSAADRIHLLEKLILVLEIASLQQHVMQAAPQIEAPSELPDLNIGDSGLVGTNLRGNDLPPLPTFQTCVTDFINDSRDCIEDDAGNEALIEVCLATVRDNLYGCLQSAGSARVTPGMPF